MLKVYKAKFNFQSPTYRQILIDRLPDKQRDAVRWVETFGLKYRAIADIRHTPYYTAKANYRHGMARIYQEILRDEQTQAVAPHLQGVPSGFTEVSGQGT